MVLSRKKKSVSQNKRLKFKKYVYDAVHGYIGITEPELDIIDHKAFQRTHHLRQLGPAYLVYPTATQTRFSHLLGAMFVMTEFCNNIRYQGTTAPVITNADGLQKLRLAALLHDIGHYPLSHVVEYVMENEDPNACHEKFGQHIITKTGIADVLNKNSYKPAEIVEITTGLANKPSYAPVLYKFLLDSDLDVDRVDYLLRDSYYTGVGYGKIDAGRLLNTITYDSRHGVVFEKSTEALENFFLGRYHMHKSVYYHKVVTGFEILIELIYKQFLNEKLVPNATEVFQLDDDGLYNYNDNLFFNEITSYNGDSTITREMIKMFLERKPLSSVFAELSLAEKNDTASHHQFVVNTLSLSESQLGSIATDAGIPPEWIFPKTMEYKKLLNDDDSRLAVHVIRDGKIIALSQDPRSMISILQDYNFNEPRIYTKRNYRTRVRDSITKLFSRTSRAT